MGNDTLENKLKDMILREELFPGERLTEAGLASRLGISRTPVRNILPRLASEGFLSPVGKRGYVVAQIGEAEIADALNLRALLEGWAASTLAEQGVDEETLEGLEECLIMGDTLLANRDIGREEELEYGVINGRFHQLIIDGCRSPLLVMFIERLNNVPSVAPSVVEFDLLGGHQLFDLLHRAHGFHHAIVDAIKKRDGARAEFLFREHVGHQRFDMLARHKTAGAPDKVSETEKTVLGKSPPTSDLA